MRVKFFIKKFHTHFFIKYFSKNNLVIHKKNIFCVVVFFLSLIIELTAIVVHSE